MKLLEKGGGRCEHRNQGRRDADDGCGRVGAWGMNYSQNAPGSWIPAIDYCISLGNEINAHADNGFTALYGPAFTGNNESASVPHLEGRPKPGARTRPARALPTTPTVRSSTPSRTPTRLRCSSRTVRRTPTTAAPTSAYRTLWKISAEAASAEAQPRWIRRRRRRNHPKRRAAPAHTAPVTTPIAKP